MEWDSSKKMFVVGNETRDPTVQEIVTAKYEVGLPSMLEHMDVSSVPRVIQQDLKVAAATIAAASDGPVEDPVSEVATAIATAIVTPKPRMMN